MARTLHQMLLTVGVVSFAIAAWQWQLDGSIADTTSSTESGLIRWALPGRTSVLGPGNQTYLIPRTVLTFAASVTYPPEVLTGHAFQIQLKSRFTGVEEVQDAVVDTSLDERVERIRQNGFHSFELVLPGLDVAPTGPNSFGIDESVRWQVAPPRAPGLYRGYIRPEGGTAELLGAEYEVRWRDPGDFELEIEVTRSFQYLEKLEALLLGLLGSILSLPALLALFQTLRSKADKS